MKAHTRNQAAIILSLLRNINSRSSRVHSTVNPIAAISLTSVQNTRQNQTEKGLIARSQ